MRKNNRNRALARSTDVPAGTDEKARRKIMSEKSRKLIAVSPEPYKVLSEGSKKSGVSMIKLADMIITREINFLNNPVKIAEYFKMCNERNL